MSAELLLRVDAVERLSPGLLQLQLAAAEGELPIVGAGAHLSLQLPTDPALWRSYSLMADGAQRWRIIVRLQPDSRGGSRWLHRHAKPGLLLPARSPLNLFAPQFSARHQLMIAGGVGITPFLAYLQQFRALGSAYQLHWCGRRDDADAIAALCGHDPAVKLHVGAPRQSLQLPTLLAAQPLGTALYCCGPAALMQQLREQALAAGWPPALLFQEHFASGGQAQAFTVKLRRSQRLLQVTSDQSLLEALENAGVAVPNLCRGGACGACITPLLAGQADHRDHVLDAAGRRQQIAVCVSRACAGHTLELDL